jgi:ABC-type branched-subunit amino acid transport system substrate-binding protein
MVGEKMSNRFCLATVCRVALVAAAALASPTVTNAQTGAIKIGEFFDLTGGGASAAEAGQFGTDIAIKEINEKGGINGRKIETVVADTQTDATIGVGEMKRLVLQERVDIVIGPVISQVVLAAAPVVNEGKIVQIGATGSELITPQAVPYYFSMLINAESQAKVMVKQAAEVLQAKSGAILSDSGAQAKSFVESMKKEMDAKGMKITAVQEYQYRATDMTPQLLALKRGNPDTLFLFSSSGEDVGNALKSLAELGWKVKVTGNYTVGAFAPAALKIAGKDGFKDVTGTNYTAFTYCTDADKPKAFLDFVDKAKAFKPDVAARLSMPFASLFYDGVHLVKAAVEGNGGKTDGPSITAWIEDNAGKFKGINTSLNGSKTTHFLVGEQSLAAVYPDRLAEGGIQQRFKCN